MVVRCLKCFVRWVFGIYCCLTFVVFISCFLKCGRIQSFRRNFWQLSQKFFSNCNTVYRVFLLLSVGLGWSVLFRRGCLVCLGFNFYRLGIGLMGMFVYFCLRMGGLVLKVSFYSLVLFSWFKIFRVVIILFRFKFRV